MHSFKINLSSQLIIAVMLSVILVLPLASAWADFNVRDFGALADGETEDTGAIQTAIDSASAAGGGTVYFPAGKYLLKTIILRSNVRLYLDHGAVLLGSTELTEFKPEYGSFSDSGGRRFGSALIFAIKAENVAVEGTGLIDGQGYRKYYPPDAGVARPSIIRMIDCKNVRISGVTLVNSAAWVQHYVRCSDLNIRGITVNSYSNKNNDGLDIESCERVYITGCNINSADDSIVLKSLTPNPCRDVVISDCIISGLKSAIKTGTESIGNFENITISNCTIYGTRGISLLSVDGGNINNVTISNLSMRDSYAVIVIRLGERMRPYSVSGEQRPRSAGLLKNIMISNIQAVNVTESNDFISGIPGHAIENVTLSNLRIEYAGGGKKSDSIREIQEMISEYPKARMFGTLPSYGLFIRHAKNINLNNLVLSTKQSEYRSVIKIEEVVDAKINGLHATSDEKAAPLIGLDQCGRIKIINCSTPNRINTFVQVNNCRDVVLINNELSQATHPVISDQQDTNHIREIDNY